MGQLCLASCTMNLAMEQRATRLRTPAAILETAAHLLAERGDASMSEIAAAAAVGRATLYRHFPTREALLRALASEALEEVAARIRDAGLDHVAVPEAVQRLLRALLVVGDRYVVLVRERGVTVGEGVTLGDKGEEEVRRLVGAPIRSVFQRGIDDGTLRDDLEPDALVRLFTGLANAAIEAALPRTLGVEQTAASIASLFLDGARRIP